MKYQKSELIVSRVFSLKLLTLNNNKLKEIDQKFFFPLKSIQVIQLFENDLKVTSFFQTSTTLVSLTYDGEKLNSNGFVSD